MVDLICFGWQFILTCKLFEDFIQAVQLDQFIAISSKKSFTIDRRKEYVHLLLMALNLSIFWLDVGGAFLI